jgi:hypothetical protein
LSGASRGFIRRRGPLTAVRVEARRGRNHHARIAVRAEGGCGETGWRRWQSVQRRECALRFSVLRRHTRASGYPEQQTEELDPACAGVTEEKAAWCAPFLVLRLVPSPPALSPEGRGENMCAHRDCFWNPLPRIGGEGEGEGASLLRHSRVKRESRATN